jgi:hypothetical protein
MVSLEMIEIYLDENGDQILSDNELQQQQQQQQQQQLQEIDLYEEVGNTREEAFLPRCAQIGKVK